MPKQRRYQITPNSISQTEEESVKSVLDRFRNRSVSPEPETPVAQDPPIFEFPAVVGAHTFEAETPTHEAGGRPDDSAGDANDEQQLTPTRSDGGRPHLETDDARTSPSETPTILESGRHIASDTDAHLDAAAASTNGDSGRQICGDVGANAPNGVNEAPTTANTSGAKAPTNKSVGAHKSGRRGDRHNNTSLDRLALRPNAEILKKVKHFCVEHNYTLVNFFEMASLKFMELGAHTDTSGGALAPLDNRRLMMLFKTKPLIINLYLAYTAAFNEASQGGAGKWSGKWLPRDDEAAAVYNEVDVRIIELGILQTQVNKGIGSAKIQTFQYYTGEINTWIEAGISDNALTEIVKHHRAQLQKWMGREIDLAFLEEST